VIHIENGVCLVEGTGKTHELSARQLELKQRIEQAAARTQRLKSWIAFFRTNGETGLGDTVQRLKSLAGKRAIKEDLRRIERICGCETSVAIQRLNEQHPYN
jgi:hypothetical protein